MSIEFSDPIMNKLHQQVEAKFGSLAPIAPVVRERYLQELAEAIASQQLAGNVAKIIVGRLNELVGEWSAEKVLSLEVPQYRSIGLSNYKANYVRNIAQSMVDGLVVYDQFEQLSDEEIILELIKIKGVGRWTAEMFLIFSLGRPDVFSAGDYGLKKAIMNHYHLAEKVTAAQLNELANQWQPNKSLACRILWKSLELKKS